MRTAVPAKLESTVTWVVRILLVPPAAFLIWNSLRDVRYLLVATPDTSVLAPAVELVLAALLLSAIFSSSPPWRNEHLKVFLCWVGSFAALLLNFVFAFIVVSYVFGHSFRVHLPLPALEEICLFALGLGLFILEIYVFEKLAKKKSREQQTQRPTV